MHTQDESTRSSIGSGSDHDWIKGELIKAYHQLAVTWLDPTDGSRTVTLAGLRPLEVRLTQLSRARIPLTIPPLWLEIFSPEGSTVDGCGCFDMSEDELTEATQIISDACQEFSAAAGV
ncbi:hypothetical protein IC232_27110 [Microvirga sp. BT688]|nr:hypothetical protein [Microvirga sp.]